MAKVLQSMARAWQCHRTNMVNQTCQHNMVHNIAFAWIIAKALQTQFANTWQKHYTIYTTMASNHITLA
jgi:hypothetical protein